MRVLARDAGTLIGEGRARSVPAADHVVGIVAGHGNWSSGQLRASTP